MDYKKTQKCNFALSYQLPPSYFCLPLIDIPCTTTISFELMEKIENVQPLQEYSHKDATISFTIITTAAKS